MWSSIRGRGNNPKSSSSHIPFPMGSKHFQSPNSTKLNGNGDRGLSKTELNFNSKDNKSNIDQLPPTYFSRGPNGSQCVPDDNNIPMRPLMFNNTNGRNEPRFGMAQRTGGSYLLQAPGAIKCLFQEIVLIFYNIEKLNFL